MANIVGGAGNHGGVKLRLGDGSNGIELTGNGATKQLMLTLKT